MKTKNHQNVAQGHFILLTYYSGLYRYTPQQSKFMIYEFYEHKCLIGNGLTNKNLALDFICRAVFDREFRGLNSHGRYRLSESTEEGTKHVIMPLF